MSSDGSSGGDGRPHPEVDALRAELQSARDEAERARDRLEFLVEVGRTVARSQDHAEVLQRVLDLAVPRIADGGLALLPEADGLRRVAAAHRDPEAAELARTWVVGTIEGYDAGNPSAEAYRTGEIRTRRSTDVPDYSKAPDFLRRTVETYGLRSWVSVPIRAGGEVLGVISLGFNDPDAVESDDGLALAVEIAGRTASGLIDALLFEHEQRVTLALQTAVLPARLPAIDGWQVSARYLPAQTDVHVGGDWYDAFALPDGRFAVTIGDVSGHGIDAAATMGQLRNGLRAYAIEGHAPAEVLARLGALLELTGEEQYASVICAAVDPASGVVEWCSAGHPPMLHIGPGTAAVAGEPHGILLGALASSVVPTSQLVLAPGESVVLYTDGLVERRGEDIDEAIAGLAAVLGEAQADGADAEALCAAALGARGVDLQDDDVCVLVVRRC